MFKQMSGLSWVMACVLGGALGCENSDRPPMAPVSGVVLYQGQPVAGAAVTFFPEKPGMRSAGGTTDAQGRFELMTYEEGDGAVQGKHRVAIVKRAPPAASKLPAGMGAAFQEEMEAQAAEQGKPLLPQKYFLPDSSGIAHEVVAGKNEFKLELTD